MNATHPRQTVTTKYLCPVGNRGARMKATASGGISKTIAYNHGLSDTDNHRAAARALIVGLGWDDGVWFEGGHALAGMVFVDTKGQQPLGM